MMLSKAYIKNTFYNLPLVWKTIEFFQGVSYGLNYNKYYRFENINSTSLREINIEFSSACNLRCQFCALDHEKPQSYIEPELLRKLLTQLTEDKRFQNVKRIQLYNGGETLLHPNRIQLLEILKEFKSSTKAKGLAFPKVVLLTNAMLMREKMSKQIIDLDVVDELMVSLDGGTPEDFEDIRVRAKWPIFYKNISTFLDYRDQQKANIFFKTITILPDHLSFNIDWMHPQFKEILLRADDYELRRLHNWAGEVEGQTPNKSHKLGCTLLMKQLVILPNGDVTVCCSDLNSRGVVGNLNKQSLYDVYQSPKRLKWLKLLYQNKKEEIDLCRQCETF